MWGEDLSATDCATQPAEYENESSSEIEGAPKPQVWARLVSNNKHFSNVDLVDKKYTIGRRPACHIQVNHPAVSGCH